MEFNMEFIKELKKSGLIHQPLSDIAGYSYEEKRKREAVLKKRELWTKRIQPDPVHQGEGTLWIGNEGETAFFAVSGKAVTYCWPPQMSPDGDCAFYGIMHAKLLFSRENWEQYDRLRFRVRPCCDGTRITNVTTEMVNDGIKKVPDEYLREGSHVTDLVNHEWNDCIWEFGSMARDAVTEVDFTFRLNGKETASGDDIIYHICDVVLEQTAHPCRDKGWECEEGKVAYATTGYFTRGSKTAVTNRRETEFDIVSDDTRQIVYYGNVIRVPFCGTEYGVLDFSKVEKPGHYRICMGDYCSERFVIDQEVYGEAIWKAVNFLFCERCGYPVPRKHGLCHMDVIAEHLGKKVPFCGGWHDAGDMSQQMIHTAETVDALLGMAETVKEKHPMLAGRLLEEAGWGLEFVLRTRFGDGYRATGVGLVRWTNGFIGDEDDVEARVHNHAIENLVISSVCAHAAMVLTEEDRELAYHCKEAAREDFRFGLSQYEKMGLELPIMWEHTYGVSDSQCMAVIVSAAAKLHRLFGGKEFEEIAGLYMERLLSCQESEEANPYRGYFYRDAQKKSIVHFTHQSREYLFAEAMAEFLQVFPNHLEKETALDSLKLYGFYLQKLMQHSSPYRMFPAGVYCEEEAEDGETFPLLHLLVEHGTQKNHYRAQVRNGQKVTEHLYVRQFPVWFSFRGNTAIHLSLGRAAGILGNFFKDDVFLQMAREQLYWVNGKNPFVQSLMYGEGVNYPVQYAVLPGEMVGEMPVGIQTFEDEDEPYWPRTNNATYKEVWTSSVNRWLWVLTEISKSDYI